MSQSIDRMGAYKNSLIAGSSPPEDFNINFLLSCPGDSEKARRYENILEPGCLNSVLHSLGCTIEKPIFRMLDLTGAQFFSLADTARVKRDFHIKGFIGKDNTYRLNHIEIVQTGPNFVPYFNYEDELCADGCTLQFEITVAKFIFTSWLHGVFFFLPDGVKKIERVFGFNTNQPFVDQVLAMHLDMDVINKAKIFTNSESKKRLDLIGLKTYIAPGTLGFSKQQTDMLDVTTEVNYIFNMLSAFLEMCVLYGKDVQTSILDRFDLVPPFAVIGDSKPPIPYIGNKTVLGVKPKAETIEKTIDLPNSPARSVIELEDLEEMDPLTSSFYSDVDSYVFTKDQKKIFKNCKGKGCELFLGGLSNLPKGFLWDSRAQMGLRHHCPIPDLSDVEWEVDGKMPDLAKNIADLNTHRKMSPVVAKNAKIIFDKNGEPIIPDGYLLASFPTSLTEKFIKIKKVKKQNLQARAQLTAALAEEYDPNDAGIEISSFLRAIASDIPHMTQVRKDEIADLLNQLYETMRKGRSHSVASIFRGLDWLQGKYEVNLATLRKFPRVYKGNKVYFPTNLSSLPTVISASIRATSDKVRAGLSSVRESTSKKLGEMKEPIGNAVDTVTVATAIGIGTFLGKTYQYAVEYLIVPGALVLTQPITTTSNVWSWLKTKVSNLLTWFIS